MPTLMKPAAMQHIPTQYTQTHKDMMAYNGTFDLVLNIRRTFTRYGKLSDKQWAAVAKCVKPLPVHDPNVILVPNCTIPIVISASSARHIAKANKWPMNPCTLLVTQVLSQDRGTMKLKVKMDWSGTVSVCRCCGKSLTDWRSQATGVGPVCVKGTNIQYVRNQGDIARFQQEMENLCNTIGEVVVDIKRWAFKDGLGAVTDAIACNTPVTVAPQAPPVATPAPVAAPPDIMLIRGKDITYVLKDFIWNEKERTLSPAKGVTIKAPLEGGDILIYNPVTGVRVKFIENPFGWYSASSSNVESIKLKI